MDILRDTVSFVNNVRTGDGGTHESGARGVALLVPLMIMLKNKVFLEKKIKTLMVQTIAKG